uniref:Sulfatase-modifying factor enzyme 1 n=1 Tax=Candidatus Kentrum sp. TUN TaxID=2126343 RepID=A0A451APN2_9GAMM|nr:MAG: hypothetical protein BECKTUN1418F_GA0071002_11793 [Candidatus Kentron sp. TUN]VFK68011.1 MAG: hypothetical protein BECKTUN1418E_GA0071001_11743 [Candidatus Kentron sp. TUN]
MGEVLNDMGDDRPGVGVDPETKLPAMSWAAIPGSPALKLGEGMRGEANLNAFDSERWEREETITVGACYLSVYPVTVIQYQAFVAAGGYEDQRWWTDAG